MISHNLEFYYLFMLRVAQHVVKSMLESICMSFYIYKDCVNTYYIFEIRIMLY